MSYDRNLDSIEDIVRSIGFAIEFTSGISEEFFSVDHAAQNVVIRELTIIGEATRRLTPEFLRYIRRFRLPPFSRCEMR